MYTHNLDQHNLLEKFMVWDTRNQHKYRNLTDDEHQVSFPAKNTLHKFGTAGIRKKVGIGCCKLNDVTIVQITNGLLNFAEYKFGESLKTRGVVIGFDVRHDSEYWSKIVANCCISRKIEEKSVRRFEKVVPTPFVSFAVKEYNACFGVMITASHNPKEDNGYKIYWENSAHVMGGIEAGISEEIRLESQRWKTSELACFVEYLHELSMKRFEKLPEFFYYDHILRIYLSRIKAELDDANAPNGEYSTRSDMAIVYSAFHGVGNAVMLETFKNLGFTNVKSVPEQAEPDHEFPTLKLPNPEDGEIALKCSIDFANSNGSKLIVANDPDADRLAVAEKQGNSWRVFTGNETAAIVGFWAFKKYTKRQSTNSGAFENCVMFGSMVSSHILKSMAMKHGFKYVETLPGFKHTANLAAQMKSENFEILFGFEDSIGFMYGDMVLDKDGISAAVVVAQIADHYRKYNKNLSQVLDEIYLSYGYHANRNSYVFSDDSGKTEQLFSDISEKFKEHKSIKIGDEDDVFYVKRFRDVRNRYDSDAVETQFVSCGFFVIFDFENGASLILRTSGTEPKIKYYSEMIGEPGEDSFKVQGQLEILVKVMIREVLQPEKYGFERAL